MGTPMAEEAARAAGQSARGAGAGRSVASLLTFAQVAIMAGLYYQALQLNNTQNERQIRLRSLEEKVKALYTFVQSEHARNFSESCPPCPSVQQKMEAALREIHNDFEKTAEKLSAGVTDLHSTINVHVKKFTSLAEKAQKNPLFKLLQNA